VCDPCVEVAYLVAYAVSDTSTTQCHGARGLGDLASKGPPPHTASCDCRHSRHIRKLTYGTLRGVCRSRKRLSGCRGMTDDGLPKVVSLGGLDVLLFLCSSPQADVATVATGVLETMARRGKGAFSDRRP